MAPIHPDITSDQDTLVQESAEIEHAQDLSRKQEKPPAEVAGYRIGKCIGNGAYGSVWEAVEVNTGRRVAIKFYTHRSGLDWSLLNREVEKLAVLYTSRNVVGLLEVGWDSVPPYYVMELLENGSLANLLWRGPLPAHEAVRIAKGILLALVHAHGRGILHCDLKPANVLLDDDLEPRLCDFGQSRLSHEQNPALGTLFYMAPEQADMEAIPDARWDVYALGALLYQSLCGKAPHHSPENERLIRSAETLEERLAIYRRILLQSPRPNEHRKQRGVDKRLADIVDRCLHVNPEKRIPNAQAALDLLELRDRQRARRPLMVLGVVGPCLLLLAMVPIARNAMYDAVNTAQGHLSARALESVALPAEILANSVAREVENRKVELERAASDEKLRAAIMAAEKWNWIDRNTIELRLNSAAAKIASSVPGDSNRQQVENALAGYSATLAASSLFQLDREAVENLLEDHKGRVDAWRQRQERHRDTSWFLTDANGFQRWRSPPDANILDRCFAWRDYYHGRGMQYPEDAVPTEIRPIEQTYVSMPFRSTATKRYMIAISTPVWDLEKKRVIGVLAMTTHLGQLLPEYQSSIRGGENEKINRVIALVDSRNSRLLDHPWLTPERLKSLSDETFERMTHFPGISGDSEGNGCGRNYSYHDPVAAFAGDAYSGEWLAAYCPVGTTGWMTIVQERKAEALRPVDEMRAGLIEDGMWGIAISCGLIAALCYFVLWAMNSRRLLKRRKETLFGDLSNGSTLSDG